MLRSFPRERELLLKLVSAVAEVNGALARAVAALRRALDEEAYMRPLDDLLCEQTGSSQLHHYGVTPIVGIHQLFSPIVEITWLQN